MGPLRTFMARGASVHLEVHPILHWYILARCSCHIAIHLQLTDPLHYEIWKYYQSTSKARIKVLQNLIVQCVGVRGRLTALRAELFCCLDRWQNSWQGPLALAK